MGDFMSTVRVKILNLLKPVLICYQSQKHNRKKFLAWYLQVFKRYSNLKISKFWFFSWNGNFHDFLTQKFELFCIAHCMGKSSQIWCRMSMNFCECVANILDIWSWQCIFESLNLRDGHPKKFGFKLKILFVLVPFNPFFKSYGRSINWKIWWMIKLLGKVKKIHKCHMLFYQS